MIKCCILAREMAQNQQHISSKLRGMRKECDERLEAHEKARVRRHLLDHLASKEKLLWACSLLGAHIWSNEKEELRSELCELAEDTQRPLLAVPKRRGNRFSRSSVEILSNQGDPFKLVNSQLSSIGGRHTSLLYSIIMCRIHSVR